MKEGDNLQPYRGHLPNFLVRKNWAGARVKNELDVLLHDDFFVDLETEAGAS